MPTDLAARAHRSLEALHTMVYFVPEAEEELTKVGLRPGRMCYFASRSAPMGPVPAAVTTATFYNFNPALVARHVPRAWSLASVGDILEARLTAADRALRRLLSDEAVTSPAVVEAAELARAAATDLQVVGRPLFAGHASLDWPGEPHLVLWHAVTLLREYRGDGHIAALLDAGLAGLQALVTHTVTGHGFTQPAAIATRGWSADEWNAAADELADRGLLAGQRLTPQGERLRSDVEARTDRLAAAPWRALGDDGTTRLIELGRTLSRQVVTAGAFPAGTFARSPAH